MRSWPACVCTSEAYFAGCCSALMWSILILMPVSLVKRWPISDSFLSESGAKLFQHRYETSRCWPRAGGTPVARMPARPVPAVVVRKRRRVIVAMIPPLSFGSTGRPCRRPWVRLVSGQLECAWEMLLEHHVEPGDQHHQMGSPRRAINTRYRRANLIRTTSYPNSPRRSRRLNYPETRGLRLTAAHRPGAISPRSSDVAHRNPTKWWPADAPRGS